MDAIQLWFLNRVDRVEGLILTIYVHPTFRAN
jgi:hypothetical protein